MKNCFLTGLLLLVCLPFVFGQPVSPDPNYKFYKGTSALQDRIFYLFTLLERVPGVPQLINKDSTLTALRDEYTQRVTHPVSSGDLTAPLQFAGNTISKVSSAFITLLQQHPKEMERLVSEMRSSGLFQLYAGKTDPVLLSLAWKDAADGMNYILNAYTNGKGLRYPVIDSATYYVMSPAYRAMVQHVIEEVGKKKPDLFFQPSLHVALELLTLNRRDEAVRYEPLSDTNRDAYKQIKKTDWNKYPYTAMLILGASPVAKEAISETGKSRCRTGAELYRKGMAPFIIVSGGHVRPVGTQYSEAVEMRKYLVNELKIPASAVMVDPYARHTTTNVRNAVRIVWQSGIPVDKRMMCVSDVMHVAYVNSPMFTQRCTTELGYMPAADIKQADLYFLSFLPDLRSLQVNVFDPLDP
ncbi:YdcF family protein [Chitinophaga sp. RCC_12]|uniref:YdcF family protein n=1 Tax=Chitinophaga sp. RCC_12 TaxID=3239226 RepID=UPI0035246C1A